MVSLLDMLQHYRKSDTPPDDPGAFAGMRNRRAPVGMEFQDGPGWVHEQEAGPGLLELLHGLPRRAYNAVPSLNVDPFSATGETPAASNGMLDQLLHYGSWPARAATSVGGNALAGMQHSAAYPGEVAAGRADPNNEEALGLAMLMGMGGSAFARPANSLGMFARPERAAKYLKPEEYAVHESPIGPLAEFPTKGARLRPQGFEKYLPLRKPRNREGPLGDVLDSESLFKVYPELRGFSTKSGPSTNGYASGVADTEAKTIEAFAGSKPALLSALLHEAQHQGADLDSLPYGFTNDPQTVLESRAMGFGNDMQTLDANGLYDHSAGEWLGNSSMHSDHGFPGYSLYPRQSRTRARGDMSVDEMRATPPDFSDLTLWDYTTPEATKRLQAKGWY